MKTRLLGRTGIRVSQICMGTMTFGSMADESASLQILDRAFDAGVDFIDAAEVYPVPPDPSHAGRTEEICSKWLASKPRDAVIVATKVAGPGGGWFQTPVRHGRTALDRHHIDRAIDASLRRLGTDYVDLYQTHWPDPDVPIDDTLEALDSGKYQDGAWPEGARFSRYREHSPRTRAMTARFVNHATLASTARLAAIAAEHGLALVTLATAWTLARDFVASTIIGATSPGQLEDTLAAAEVELAPAVLEACDRVTREIPYPMG